MTEVHFLYIESYGCTANKNNSEMLAGLCKEAGLDIISKPELADVIIVNSCIVKTPTEEKIRFRIKELEKLKKPIIISGCFTGLKDVDAYFLANIKDVTKLVKQIEQGQVDRKQFETKKREIRLCLPKFTQDKQGITQISEGCLGDCAYCATKLAKGSLFSYPEEKILENITNDLRKGCKEIFLTSQDNAAYGLDQGDPELANLVKKILRFPGFFKLRLGMMNPENLKPILSNLLELYDDIKLYKFIHIPVQSGSNKILRAMNRKYTREEFLSLIKLIKEKFPDMAIATDIIVGYPGEGEKEFLETLDLIKQLKPDMLNVTKFWPRKNTQDENKKQDKESAERAEKVMQLHLKEAESSNKRFIGRAETILIYDEPWKGNFLARDKNYRQVIVKSDRMLLNKFTKAIITGVKPHYLLADLVYPSSSEPSSSV